MPTSPPLLALLAAVGLALVHIIAGRLRFLTYVPRSRSLSFAGGVSVAYVFVHLLPELTDAQESLSRAASELALVAERHVYLIALLGLATFYGLDALALRSRQHQQSTAREDRTGTGVFAVHIASFALYNALIGYLLLHRESSTDTALLIYTVAMGLHFVVNDAALRHHHKDRYDSLGRWIVAAAVVGGWGVGLATEIHDAAIATLVGFLAGGVILNVLKEEVPRESQSRFSPFAAGLAFYSAVLLIT